MEYSKAIHTLSKALNKMGDTKVARLSEKDAIIADSIYHKTINAGVMTDNPISVANETGANYVFVSDDGNSKVPYSIIGKKEEETLRNKLYKDVSSEVKQAFDSLSMMNYIDEYEKYSANDFEPFLLKQKKPLVSQKGIECRREVLHKYLVTFLEMKDVDNHKDAYMLLTHGKDYDHVKADISQLDMGELTLRAKNVGKKTTRDGGLLNILINVEDRMHRKIIPSGIKGKTQKKLETIERYKLLLEAMEIPKKYDDKFIIFTKGRLYEEMQHELEALDVDPDEILQESNTKKAVINDASRLKKIISLEEKLMQKDISINSDREERFMQFIFGLPLEDQNLSSNDKLIVTNQEVAFPDVANAIMQTYHSEPEIFKRYFDVLSDQNKDKLALRIKTSDNPNISVNKWLSEEGYKMVKFDPLNMYRTDKDSFMKFFNSVVDQDRDFAKKVIFDIFENESCDDKDLASWLETNYKELFHEVGSQFIERD